MGDAASSRAQLPRARLALRVYSDERLARLASTGNATAFATLYERHHQALYRYCLSIVRLPQDAQDALQSSFERAFAALRARERDIAVRPWLFRIAHNESISVLRRRRPEDRVLDELDPSPHTVEGRAEERARLATLVRDLQALGDRQRSALVMRELSGLSIAEIAAALSMSEGVAKQTLFEARTSLHEFAEGRAMPCEDVRRAISDGDRRVLRSRKMRAHLADCAGCGEFRSLIDSREADLLLLAPPLPALAATTLLSGVLAHGAGGGHAVAVSATSATGAAGATSAAGAASAASHIAAPTIVKGLAGLALTAAIGTGAAQLASHHSSSHHTPAPAHARKGSTGSSASGNGAGSAGTSRRAGRRARSRSSTAPAGAANAASKFGAGTLTSPAGALTAPSRSNHGHASVKRHHAKPAKPHTPRRRRTHAAPRPPRAAPVHKPPKRVIEEAKAQNGTAKGAASSPASVQDGASAQTST
jgi:RNA polymerase sigma factor (sigma-70 family)